MATLQRFSLIASGVVLLVGLTGAALVLHLLHRPATVTADTVVNVAQGESFAAVAHGLVERGVLEDARPLIWYAALSGAARDIRSGEFSLADAHTGLDILDTLRRGTPVQHTATLVEGWTVAQALTYLASLEPLRATLGEVSPGELMVVLGLEAQPAEGWFFPDTYQFERGADDATVLLRAYRTMQRELDRAWQDRDDGLPYETPYEVLVLASLVEKETGLEGDRGKIARVFVSRLEQGMRLQTDPSVIYGLGAQFDGNLTRAHLAQDGPYNSYRRTGLPPTPIALPGRRSLQAAVRPDPVPYLYFVARGDGTSQFSTTLDEHLAAVRRYQLKQR